MDSINIESGVKVPKLKCNADTGEILIEGVSVPENTVDFYHPVVLWMQEYVKEPQAMTTFNLKLEYFNTSTSVILLNMFRVLSPLGKDKLTINWHFEEDDIEMEEAGQDYSNMVDATFNIIKVKEF